MTEILPFTGNPFDRGEHVRKDAAALAQLATHERALTLVFDSEWRLLCDVSGVQPLISWDRGSGEVLLGLEDGKPRYGSVSKSAMPDVPGLKWLDLRSFALQAPADEAAIAGHAKALLDWHVRHHFCAQCGAATEPAWGGSKRLCAGCGAEHFPRTDPVVIMLAVNGDACLVGSNSRFPMRGMYSALAGFLEQGETIEEAVKRELFEEAGVIATNVRYVTSQPWPFPSSLMIGCIAEVTSRETNPDPDEIADLKWLDRPTLARALQGDTTLDFFVPPKIAIARRLLEVWLKEG